jgi:heptose I phosphotransferase
MPDFRWIDRDFWDLAVLHGLNGLRDLVARRDGQVLPGDRRGRDMLRLELHACDGRSVQVLVKRERSSRPGELIAPRLAAPTCRTSARWELMLLERLSAAGIACPRPLACFERGWWPACGVLVLEEPRDWQPLNEVLADCPASLAAGDEVFGPLAREIARLHGLGIDHRELYSSRVLLSREGMAWRCGFRDLHNARCAARLGPRRRAASLAALWATLPRRLATPRQREQFFDAYLCAAEMEDLGIELVAEVDRGVERLLTQRRIWEIRESDTETHRGVIPLESVDPGKMWIDREFRPTLEAAGLAHFDDVMSTTQGRLLRALPDRENWRLELHGPHGPRGAYLKKHHVRDWGTWWRARLGTGPGRTAGRVEARNVARLARSGIAAMRLIAYGEKLHPSGRLESFVLTEELAGHTQLDHYLRQRFPPLAGWRPRDGELDQLIDAVADVAARFHRLGYNHRDLYCCHFFIREREAGDFQVNLIDLQRVEHRRRFRWRWLVKDLAQLAYSAPRDRITCTQKLRFLKRYLGVERLRPQDRRLVRRVLAKQRWMEFSQGKHP